VEDGTQVMCGRLSKRASLEGGHTGLHVPRISMSELAQAQHKLERELDLNDDRPEAWTARGVCRRVFHRAAQKELWLKKADDDADDPSDHQDHRHSLQHTGEVRRKSHQHNVHLNANSILLSSAKDATGTVRPPDGNSHVKIQRATSFYICVSDDEEEEKTKVKLLGVQGKAAPNADAGGTGTDTGDGMAAEAASTSADTGGTRSCHVEANPLKELMTAKKPNVEAIRDLLERLGAEAERWINTPLDAMNSPVVPVPLFFAIGATTPALVGLVLEFTADVNKGYQGTKMYNGWIKPDSSPFECVTNRRSRFVGTMLGDRLEQILDLLTVAREKTVNLTSPKAKAELKTRISARLSRITTDEAAKAELTNLRKSVELKTENGTMTHTQGHPSVKYDILTGFGDMDLSTVKMAVCRKSGERRAVKTEVKVEESIIWDEINIIRKLSHPNIIQIFETFEDDSNIFVVLEVCTGGELFDRLAVEGGVPEHHAAFVMKQLASAVEYCHAKNICHRDIQPENFLLKDDAPLHESRVCLIDFNTAKEFGPNMPMKTKVCTLHYVAPEILTRKETPYSEKVDVWSLGIVFYVVLCGCPPFFGETEMTILKRIKRGAYKFNPPEIWANISEEAKDLVKEMLVVDPSARYSSAEVAQHPWWLSSKQNGTADNHLTGDQLNNMRNFHARNRVQKVVLKLRAQQLSDSAVAELRKVFRKLDETGTGEVAIADIRDKIRRIPTLNDNMEEIMRVLWSQEAGTGRVNFDRFLDAMVRRTSAIQKEACKAIFDVFDFDGAGKITRDELKVALGLDAEENDFKGHVETVFGMTAQDMKSRITQEVFTRDEYSFDEFFELLQEQISRAASAENTTPVATA
jgi:serine/threonine protein kinase